MCLSNIFTVFLFFFKYSQFFASTIEQFCTLNSQSRHSWEPREVVAIEQQVVICICTLMNHAGKFSLQILMQKIGIHNQVHHASVCVIKRKLLQNMRGQKLTPRFVARLPLFSTAWKLLFVCSRCFVCLKSRGREVTGVRTFFFHFCFNFQTPSPPQVSALSPCPAFQAA